MIRTAFVLSMLLALAACNTASSSDVAWVKPGASGAQTQKDALECEYEAKKSTGHQGGMGQALFGAIGEGIERDNHEAKLKTMCMQTRGYGTQQASR